jgi:hypothetical protein
MLVGEDWCDELEKLIGKETDKVKVREITRKYLCDLWEGAREEGAYDLKELIKKLEI